MKLETKHKVKRVKRYGEMDATEKNMVDNVLPVSDNILAQKIYDYNNKMNELINNAKESKGRSL